MFSVPVGCEVTSYKEEEGGVGWWWGGWRWKKKKHIRETILRRSD